MPPKLAKITKEPPELTNDCNYMDWRKDVKVWKMVNNDADKTKFGGLLYLSLKGKAREAYVKMVSVQRLALRQFSINLMKYTSKRRTQGHFLQLKNLSHKNVMRTLASQISFLIMIICKENVSLI